MGRGRVAMKKIEDKTNRQVTFSKRKNGIMKKAHELSLLCDATVSLFLLSPSNKLHHYLTPGAQLKKIYDDYQHVKCVDLWSPHYQEMLKQKKELMETNNMNRIQIRQRMGGDLEKLGVEQLRGLEQDMDKALDIIHAQKLQKIKAQTGIYRKKVKNLEQVHGNLLFDLEVQSRTSRFCSAKEDQEGYEGAFAYGHYHGGSAGNSNWLYGPTPSRHPNLLLFQKEEAYGNCTAD